MLLIHRDHAATRKSLIVLARVVGFIDTSLVLSMIEEILHGCPLCMLWLLLAPVLVEHGVAVLLGILPLVVDRDRVSVEALGCLFEFGLLGCFIP